MKVIQQLAKSLPPAKFQILEDATDNILMQGKLNRSDRRKLERFMKKVKSSRL